MYYHKCYGRRKCAIILSSAFRVPVHIEVVGSCCTLITRMFYEQLASVPGIELANMLRGTYQTSVILMKVTQLVCTSYLIPPISQCQRQCQRQ